MFSFDGGLVHCGPTGCNLLSAHTLIALCIKANVINITLNCRLNNCIHFRKVEPQFFRYSDTFPLTIFTLAYMKVPIYHFMTLNPYNTSSQAPPLTIFTLAYMKVPIYHLMTPNPYNTSSQAPPPPSPYLPLRT